MNNTKILEIAEVLQRAAQHRRLVTYKRLHSLFKTGDSLTERYRLLQDAAEFLSDCAQLDYGCLMSLDDGLPGEDFFQRFRHNRPHDFEAVLGYAAPGRSKIKRRFIAEAERQRVFQHAAAEKLRASSTQ
jgi:hypothetical protein